MADGKSLFTELRYWVYNYAWFLFTLIYFFMLSYKFLTRKKDKIANHL